jgi:serine/threonine-protein kinase
MAFELGQTYGGYEFIDVVEMSKTSVMYRVRNVVAQRFELLKILPKTLQDDRERVERFLREIKVHARILHPNIVAFYNAVELEGQFVMTTELVEGVTLGQRLELAPLPWREAAGYLCQILSALGYAHKHGVVHREITPDTILLTVDGVAKLASFALAKAVTDQQLTVMGTVLGAVEYMSPEQVKANAPLDARADLYSVGAVLYKLVTGRPPFECTSQFEMMLAQVEKDPKTPSSINKDVPAEFDRIILKALAKDPALRFQDAGEFRVALETAERSLTAMPIATEPQVSHPVREQPVASVSAPASGPATPSALHAPLPSSALQEQRTSSREKVASRWGYWQLLLAGIGMFLLVTLVFITLARLARF